MLYVDAYRSWSVRVSPVPMTLFSGRMGGHRSTGSGCLIALGSSTNDSAV